MAGFFDIFKSSGNNFYFRDAKNANRFRPDANPVRQKFQGYVNFVFNRDIYEELYGDGTNTTEFRNTIGSLVRTAELPSVEFKTETRNSYNRKNIVNTGVEYSPISMTVYDTVGNEWLTVLMKYFSYHYMNPRNKGDFQDRDLDGSRRQNNAQEAIGSNFGPTSVWDSNKAGYDPNITAKFFERIDFVLYHGGQGVQYSIFNPVLTGFKPSEIDYSDNTGFRDFQLNFQYESFTTYSNYNFGLSQEDLGRFENLADFSNIKTFQEGTKAFTLSDSVQGENVPFLGDAAENSPSYRKRSGQPQYKPDSKEWTGGNPDGSELNETPPRKTYGAPYVYSGPSDTLYTGNPFVDTLINVADAGLSAAISGGNIKDATLGAALGGATSIIGDALVEFKTNAIKDSSPNQPRTGSNGNAPTLGGE